MREVVGGRAHHQLVIALALIRQHVVKELLAISHREVTETALSTGVVLEVLVGCLPISFYWCPLKIFGDFRDFYFLGQPIYWTHK